jgi:hypothetical protein
MNDARIADAPFHVTSEGYARLLAWMRSFGRLHAAGPGRVLLARVSNDHGEPIAFLLVRWHIKVGLSV